MNNQKSKHIVKVLDLTELSKHVLDCWKNNGNDISGLEMKPQGVEIGIVVDLKGNHYLIDNEACGESDPIEIGKAHILWYKSHYNEEGRMDWFDCMPCVETTLSLQEVNKIPVKKKLSLDEFIRKGGDRLSRNLGNWDNFLSGKIDANGNRI